MSDHFHNTQSITDKIQQIISAIPEEKTEVVIKEIIKANRIFVFGVGRSGLVGQAFAMRLVHLGQMVYFVGEVTTPAITPSDIIIVISGSGKTNSVCNVTEAAKNQKAKIIAITEQTDSPVAKLSDVVVEVSTKQGERNNNNNYFVRQLVSKTPEITPMGTLFELSVMIYFDSIIPILMSKIGISEKYMKGQHSNLE